MNFGAFVFLANAACARVPTYAIGSLPEDGRATTTGATLSDAGNNGGGKREGSGFAGPLTAAGKN